MKKFTVRPRSLQGKIVKVGAPNAGADEWVLLGRLSEAGPLTDVNFDLSYEHVIAILGKRGSGKSYALGSLVEGLCTRQNSSTISHVSRRRAALLFDTLGVFQWMDIPLTEGATEPVLKEQLALRRGWHLKSEALDVQVWIPFGSRKPTTPADHREFRVNTSDFSASDWGYLLNLDILQDRMGQLLNDAYAKTVVDGWTNGHKQHAPNSVYAVEDLIQCVEEDAELCSSYQAETRRAVIQQLSVYKRNPLFAREGTLLADLLRPGALAVLPLNKLPDELRAILVTALIRKIIQARIDASEDEKDLKIRSDLTSEQRKGLAEALRQAVPPCWVVIDEAQNVLPSERRTAATEVLVKLVREGRNYGISFMFTTQQPSAIDQRILAQVDTVIAHKLTVQTDIDYVRRNLKSNLPDEVRYANATLSFDELLRSLDVGQAVVSNTETDRVLILEIRPRVSVHGGF